MDYENKTAFVTKKLLEEKNKIGFAYREQPDNETDSGWRFFVGDENQEYVDDANNIVLLSIEEVINLDESIKTILDNNINTAFEKENMEFKQVNDFEFEKSLEN